MNSCVNSCELFFEKEFTPFGLAAQRFSESVNSVNSKTHIPHAIGEKKERIVRISQNDQTKGTSMNCMEISSQIYVRQIFHCNINETPGENSRNCLS